MSKNWSQQQKLTKNDQKLQNTENEKIIKIKKTQKVTKPEKWKIEKVIKSKS